MKITHNNKKRKKRRTRQKIKSFSNRLRLSVFRSNKHIYAQIIDDQKQETLAAASDFEINKKDIQKKKQAFETGRMLAKKAKKKKIKKVVFDKGSYKYHGRIKALAEGAREGGLEF